MDPVAVLGIEAGEMDPISSQTQRIKLNLSEASDIISETGFSDWFNGSLQNRRMISGRFFLCAELDHCGAALGRIVANVDTKELRNERQSTE